MKTKLIGGTRNGREVNIAEAEKTAEFRTRTATGFVERYAEREGSKTADGRIFDFVPEPAKPVKTSEG